MPAILESRKCRVCGCTELNPCIFMTDISRWVYAEKNVMRLLQEYSATEIKVEVFDQKAIHALAAIDLEPIGTFVIGGVLWIKLWQREESDQRGPYLAVGLQLSQSKTKPAWETI